MTNKGGRLSRRRWFRWCGQAGLVAVEQAVLTKQGVGRRAEELSGSRKLAGPFYLAAELLAM
jgi:hypothetical protein